MQSVHHNFAPSTGATEQARMTLLTRYASDISLAFCNDAWLDVPLTLVLVPVLLQRQAVGQKPIVYNCSKHVIFLHFQCDSASPVTLL